MRYSPWIGISAFGRTSESSVRISSEHAWPDTCTIAISSCSTSAPSRASRLIESWTCSSLPGTGLAEMITVSPRSTSTFWWSPYAIRVSADMGSPWLPVQSSMTRFGGSSIASLGETRASSGRLM